MPDNQDLLEEESMNKTLSFVSSKPVVYALCCVATVLSLFLRTPGSFLLLTASAINLAFTLSISKKRMKQIALPLALVVLLVMPKQASAIFGLGDIVFDPTSYIALLQQFTQMQQMYQNAIQLYNTTVQSYEIAKQNILSLAHKDTYRTWGLSLLSSNATNRYGELNGWNAATNNGIGIPAAYQNATLPLSTNTEFLSQEQLGSSTHLADLARINVIDSTSENSMATMAQILRQQSLNQNPTSQWESSVYSNNPDLNTEAAQQNLTNLGMVKMYEQGKANLAVNSILAQQMMMQNMKDRNAAVGDLNRWQKVAEYAATETYAFGGAAEDIANHQLY